MSVSTGRDAKRRLGGLACRQQDGWAMGVLAPSGGAPGEVRAAGADTPDAVLASFGVGAEQGSK